MEHNLYGEEHCCITVVVPKLVEGEEDYLVVLWLLRWLADLVSKKLGKILTMNYEQAENKCSW